MDFFSFIKEKITININNEEFNNIYVYVKYCNIKQY